MDIYPLRMERLPDRHLLIEWSDGRKRTYAYRELQENCPCANCREKRRQPAPTGPLLPVIAPSETQPLELERMVPVGNYAYHIHFNHGCDSGIYSIDLLHGLGKEIA